MTMIINIIIEVIMTTPLLFKCPGIMSKILQCRSTGKKDKIFTVPCVLYRQMQHNNN